MMIDVLVPVGAMILTTTLFAFTLAVSFQLAYLVSDGIRERAWPKIASLAPFWQNLGLTCVLFGFLERDIQLIIFGTLLLGLRLVSQSLRAPSWHARYEPLLLKLAVVSLVLLGAVHYLPRLLA
jgi:hypothetical protein